MPTEIKVPVLPESVADATLMEWRKQVGDSVKRDENLIDLETEKVVLEVPAPFDGVITEIRKQSGDTVVAGEVIALLDNAGASPLPPAPEPANPAPAQAAAPPADSDRHGPAARRLLETEKLDPAVVTPGGKDGRITKEDIVQHLDAAKAPAAVTRATPHAAAAVPPAAVPAPAAAAPSLPASAPGERNERREPMTRLRQTIAARLVQSQQTAALLTTFNEVDLTGVMALRKKYKESFEQKHGVRLGFMSFFVKAAVQALQRIPAVNAYIENSDLVYHDYCDIGIAVSSPRGLVVPILRNVEHKSFAGIEAEINAFGEKARDGKLGLDDLTGGTFTISNGGIFGSLVSTPIINPPQSAILGMHKIQERPVASDGEVVIRPMMYLALSYDHRIIDGREAVTFLVTIKEALEDPARLLLEV